MDLITIPPDVAHAGLRGMKMVALADGPLHSLERRMLEAVQRHVLKTNFDVDSLEPITPAALAAAISTPEQRERVVSGYTIMALIDGDASAAEAALIDQFARALDVSSRACADLHHLVEHQLLIARIDIVRRSFIGQRGRAFVADQGVRGFARVLRGAAGFENPRLAARYQALADMPRGKLGREYYEFIRANGFSLPGEKDAAPEVVVFHDCLHVLAEYSTVSIEETQIASFQAGVLKKDSVFGLMFMLAQFHLGVQMTPVAAPEKLVADPELMLRAFVRGTQVNRDLCVDWRPEDYFDREVSDLRREFNIPPRWPAEIHA